MKFFRLFILAVILLSVVQALFFPGEKKIFSDPTEDSKVVLLHNDLNAEVELANCNDTLCKELVTNWRVTLAVGGEVPVNASTDPELPTPYRIIVRGSDVMRCLPVISDKKFKDYMILNLSTSTVCGKVVEPVKKSD